MTTLPILVLNSGSSSIKFSVYGTGAGEPRKLNEGSVDGIGTCLLYTSPLDRQKCPEYARVVELAHPEPLLKKAQDDRKDYANSNQRKQAPPHQRPDGLSLIHI